MWCKRAISFEGIIPYSEWIYLKTVTAEIKGVDWQPYYNQKPDTLISSCSIDKIDSLFKIEIRSYDIR